MLSNIRIVLVQTYHPGNIGASARAMKTMGLTDLVLVNPRCFPDPEASRLAAGAEDVVDQARVVSSLSEAVADCVQVVGASARLRSYPLPHYDEPAEMATSLVDNAREAPVALVFGRERFGLTNDEIRDCSHQVSIPANPDYGVLNLSQAVQVLAYETFGAWRRLPDSDYQHPRHASVPLPTRQQLGHFHDHLSRVMQASGFITQPHARTEEQLRALFDRAQPTRRDISLLRGLLSSLEEGIQDE
ncbi:RNA methyltransferase [Halomonas elongata]|uniref:tRNA (cytidine/uridine-2'-O-)-methyltransferase TrmJ n=1 Tax=Halomonas elongata TaxID=2746 RepID=A0A1B8P195_HALEL|nr:RNA methyltransferase [Halomonas elongata]MBW5801777.1 RNA methyltransferase [Halomonas elongata]MDL4862294.1 RNA methyltransferase [Halomonas elongata]OBX36045.1 tRNA (cytidine/uridine-2'-O-)-methyltransferase TrmJ [Halomonas elongata]